MNIKQLNDDELQQALKQKVSYVREGTADGVALLAEVLIREVYLTEGFASVFAYSVGELGFSKSMAWRWSRAAKAVAADQGLLARIRDGRVSLCVVAVLADRPEILAKADGMTFQEAQQRASRPGKATRDVVPPPESPEPSHFASEFRAEPNGGALPGADGATGAEEAANPKRDVLPAKQRVHFSASEATLKKLQRARELTRGQGLDAIIEMALDAFLDKRDPMRRNERREKRRDQRSAKRSAVAEGVALAPGPNPQAHTRHAKPKARARSKRFPIAVKDTAHALSGGQCTYIARNGRRCLERFFGEYDHVHPGSLGGANTLDNARLLCSAHHRMMTRRSFPDARPSSRETKS